MKTNIRIDQRVRDSFVEKLTNSFRKVLRQFQQIQKKAKVTEVETLNEVKRHSESANLFQTGDFEHQTQMLEEAHDFVPLQEIQERENAIRKIEEDIIGVNNIMKDLAIMIQEQGEVVDNIESHIEATHQRIESANTELAKARTYQGRATRKRFIFFIVLIIICALLILIIVYKSRSTP
ncbi:Syntaxin-7 [Thelohanellus kitauei]|uniref:Syntaxin-7 n=1 Tax=Thelohanellus kitauei TaxID=669202 RepID=A0A0C2MU53_THEKT|nr:Syntaxin-7 [Thelohanellus kitauei]